MSRSRKKNPFCGIAIADSEKMDKRLANRAWRRRVRVAIQTGRVIPLQREVSEVYMFAKDGKMRLDPEEYPGVVRK